MILLLSTITLTGCYDRVEINDRAFIRTVAVDKLTKKNELPEDFLEKDLNYDSKKDIKVICFMSDPEAVLGEKLPEKFTSVTAVGENVLDAMEMIKFNLEKAPYYGQARVLFLGEKLFENSKEVKEILDSAQRDVESPFKLKTFVIKGDIEKLKNLRASLDKTFEDYVLGFINNTKEISELLNTDIYYIYNNLKSSNSNVAVIPAVDVKDNKLKLEGLALIKDYKLLRYLDLKYIKPYSIILNKSNEIKKTIKYNGYDITCNLKLKKRKINLIDSNDLSYSIHLDFVGYLTSYYVREEPLDKEEVKKIRIEFEKSLKKDLEYTTNFIQKDIKVDYLELWNYTKKYHNKVYKEHINNWDDDFKKANIQYNVDIKIRSIGTSK